MKKIFRNLLVIMFGVFLISSINVKATTLLVEAIDGASIRTKTEQTEQGLRFYAKLDESVKTNLHGFYLIYGKASIQQLENAISEGDSGIIELNGKEVFKVVVPGVTDINEFSVVLTGIPDKGYLDEITVIPYVVDNDSIETLSIAPVTRSVGEVAIKMADAGLENPPQEILDLLSVVSFDLNYDDIPPSDVIVFRDRVVNKPADPIREGYKFLGWFKEVSLTTEWNFAVDVVAEYKMPLYAKWEEEVVLPSIDEVRDLAVDTDVEFVGVVTGFTDYSTANSNYDKVFVEDSTGAIIVYRAAFPVDLKIGDKFLIVGKLGQYNGLIQIAQGATVTLIDSDNDLILPVEVTNVAEINEDFQAKRVDLEGTVVSVSSTGQTMVVKVGENEITVRSNSGSNAHIVNAHLLTAVIGQGVNLNGIHVDWFNGAQLLPTTVEQIEFLEISDEMKVADAKEALELPAVATIEGLTLPEAGLHGTVITWASSNEAIIAIDGTVVLPTEETEVTLTATITVGEVIDTKEFLVTVFPEVAVLPVTVEAEFIDHGTNVPAGDITSMFGLDDNIFAIHQVNNEAGNNMWMTATELRLYSVRDTGEGTELVFEVAEGYKILSIEFTVLANYNPAAEVFVDNVSHNVYSDYGAKILVGELSATTVSIKNVHEGGSKNLQLRIGGIKITYVGGEDIEPVVKHEVSFNSDGGSVVESQTINEGSKANRPVDPTKEGFDFLGWFIGENEFDFDTLITEAITLTAHWEEAEPEEPGDEVEVTTEYIFTSKSWGTSQDDWTSGKDGDYQSGRGIQVFTGLSGANGTTKITFYNVKSIEITYSTNATKGAGTIVTKVGNETVQTFTVSKTEGTTNRSAGVINVDSLDGAITITVNCTTNSIYLYGIKIVHTES